MDFLKLKINHPVILTTVMDLYSEVGVKVSISLKILWRFKSLVFNFVTIKIKAMMIVIMILEM
jgi:hypothetical protein